MPARNALEGMVKYIQFEINKHGQRLGRETVEDVVNDMSPYELLGLIAEYVDARTESSPQPPIARALAEFKEIFVHRFSVPPDITGDSTGAAQNTAMLTGFLLGKGYSFDEIDDFARRASNHDQEVWE